jgi:hypothetical protein
LPGGTIYLFLDSDGCADFDASVWDFCTLVQTVAPIFAIPSEFFEFSFRRLRDFLRFRLFFFNFSSDGRAIFCYSV